LRGITARVPRRKAVSLPSAVRISHPYRLRLVEKRHRAMMNNRGNPAFAGFWPHLGNFIRTIKFAQPKREA
jgi:hypothetical protein